MRLALAALWTAAILAACSIPGPELQETNLPLSHDKWAHAALFFGFGWLWLRAFPDRLGAVAAAGAAFAAFTEVWQSALPIGRSGDVYDVLADVAGLALAVGAWHVWRRRTGTTVDAPEQLPRPRRV